MAMLQLKISFMKETLKRLCSGKELVVSTIGWKKLKWDQKSKDKVSKIDHLQIL